MWKALLLGAFALIVLIAQPVTAQAPVNLRFESIAPHFSEQLQPFADAVNSLGKDLSVEVGKPSGKYKLHSDIVEAVRGRQVEGGITSLFSVLREPNSSYDRIPGLMPGYDAAMRTDRAMRPGLNEAVQSDIEVLLTIPGQPYGLVTQDKIQSLKDLSGKRFGVSGNANAPNAALMTFVREIGAVPVPVPFGIGAMAAGQVDAMLLPPSVVMEFKKGFYYPLHVMLPMQAVFMNRGVVASLTDSQKGRLQIAVGMFERRAWIRQREIAEDAVENLIRSGVQVVLDAYQLKVDVLALGKNALRNFLSGSSLSAAEKSYEQPPSRDCQRLELIFATNRKQEATRRGASGLRYGHESAPLTYGVLEFGLPYRSDVNLSPTRSCKMKAKGPIEDIKLLSGRVMTQADYVKLVLPALQGNTKSIFPAIIVHGYANTFDDGARTAVEIIRDVSSEAQYGLYFSWPSFGLEPKPFYEADEKQVEKAYAPFREVLTLLSKAQGEKPFVIAHSMGSRAVVGALKDLKSNPEIRTPLLFVAPDIDAAGFARIQNSLEPYKEKPFTIYASDNDLALGLSKIINGADRVGLISGRPFALEPFDLVDVSPENRGYVAHSYLVTEPTVIQDVRLTIETVKKADGRHLHKYVRNGQVVYTSRRMNR